MTVRPAVAGRTVLITGSTDGLGRELAVRLAAEGARVLVHGRDAGRAEEVQERIREATAGADSGPGPGSGPGSGSGVGSVSRSGSVSDSNSGSGSGFSSGFGSGPGSGSGLGSVSGLGSGSGSGSGFGPGSRSGAGSGAGFGVGAGSASGSGFASVPGAESEPRFGPRPGFGAGAGAGGGGAEVLLADLADLRAVDRLADEVLARYDRLDVLINNAGLGGGPAGSARQESVDGYELRFAVNYLAGYHLTRRLLPLLTRSAPARVINVASVGQQALDFTDVMLERGYDRSRAYAQSKLAQIMFTFDLADELDPATVFVGALHPATYMATTMVREAGVSPWSTVEEGVEAVLHLLGAPSRGVPSGRYFNGTEESRADAQAYDAQARRRLRELAEGLVARALAPGRT